MRLHGRMRTNWLLAPAVLLIGFAAATTSAWAQQSTRPAESSEQTKPEPRPDALRPPPGMSIMPAPPPSFSPPAGDHAPHGCPVNDLKPLQLLV